MLKNFRDKLALSGITVLSLGIALLIFTFISAYGFLTQSLSIITSEDLARTFGEALAPLIATCIRLMYLGIMGWVASLVTIRGVTIITHTPQLPSTPQQQLGTELNTQSQLQPQKLKNKKAKDEETKEGRTQREPEVVLIPSEAIPESQTSNT
jgi:hypothetical protein